MSRDMFSLADQRREWKYIIASDTKSYHLDLVLELLCPGDTLVNGYNADFFFGLHVKVLAIKSKYSTQQSEILLS